MFQKVMWATDGSDAADRALPFAKMLAANGGGELLVAHCEELTMPGKGVEAFRFTPMKTIDELKGKIERQVAELSGDGIPSSLQVMRSSRLANNAESRPSPSGRGARTRTAALSRRSHRR